MLPDGTSNALCSFLFLFCAPAVSFTNIITSDKAKIFNFRFVIAMMFYETVIFVLLFLLFRKVFKIDSAGSVIHTLCSGYGNISYVGIPVFITLFNDIIPNTILILIHGMVTIPLIIFFLDMFTGTDSNHNFGHALLSTVKNPNIFIPVIAIILMLVKIPIPKVIADTAELLGRPTTPAGMFALGLTCAQTGNLRSSKKSVGMALFSAILKLVLCPACAWVIGNFVFRLDKWWLNSMVILAMLPAALNDFIFSKRYHSHEEYASISVLLSTLLFSVTISVYILMVGL